jgi:integrase
MPPATASARAPEPELLQAYVAWLRTTGRKDPRYVSSAQRFFARWPDPQAWAHEPLHVRLTTTARKQLALLNFLLYRGQLRPGYDYLLERRLWLVRRETLTGAYGPELRRFEAAANALGYGRRTCVASASGVAARLLIQTGRPLEALREHDFVEFEVAIAERERRHGRSFKDYRNALYTVRTVIYHLGSNAEPPPKAPPHSQWSWERHLEGVAEPLRKSFVRYLESCIGTRNRLTVSHMATRLAHFGRLLASLDPDLSSLGELDRQRHIEPFLQDVAVARHRRTGAPIAASERRSRILTIGRMLSAIAEWGWPEAPVRRLIFARDVPRLPRALPRYIPLDADRRLVHELESWPNRLRADALLLMRATGLRIGELVDLELDCVHEVPGHGAWLKVPLGKLDTERMVPLDDETLAIVDRVAAYRSPGRPLRHPRTGRLVEFLLTHQGRRISRCKLREELASVAKAAGLGVITPHQLRHTYATALVNAGVSLQVLMQLLGHSTAEMSLRYGRLFDATVRADYERALVLAKERLGPVIPATPAVETIGSWQELPVIKARLAGGYCLRTPAQGACPYANICEHCPNFRSERTFWPILATQRADTEALVADAEARGWGDEAARHRRLIERLDRLMAQDQAS